MNDIDLNVAFPIILHTRFLSSTVQITKSNKIVFIDKSL